MQTKYPFEAIVEKEASNEAPLAPIFESDGRTPNSSRNGSQSTSRSESSSEEIPLLNVRALREIYEASVFALLVTDPTTYEDAATRKEWREAMQEEIAAIERNQT